MSRRSSEREREESPGPSPESLLSSVPNDSGTQSPLPSGKAAGASDVVVIEQIRDLLLWAIPMVAKFPRSLWFSLGERQVLEESGWDTWDRLGLPAN